MPVIDKLSENIKLATKSVALNADQYGALSVASQTILGSSAYLPAFPTPIPVLPLGAPIALILNKLEALPGEMTKKTAEIIGQLQQQFAKAYADAIKQREEALNALYDNLKTKQDEIKELIPDITTEINDMNTQLADMESNQLNELNKYQRQVFKYREEALNNPQEASVWESKITDLSPWLEIILLISVDIVNLKVDIANRNLDLEFNQGLVDTTINKNWDDMLDIATDFEVAVPSYPDIPTMPSLPEIPKFPEESALVSTARKQFAKWVTTPIVPPIGVAISSILLMLSEAVANTTAQASQKEAEADAMILKMGGAI